ncbi:MAG: hypothetical protein ACK559_39735, partial [bacterium]
MSKEKDEDEAENVQRQQSGTKTEMEGQKRSRLSLVLTKKEDDLPSYTTAMAVQLLSYAQFAMRKPINAIIAHHSAQD